LNQIKIEHNIRPHEIMLFDDSKEHVESAKKLDIDAHLYKNFEDFKKLIDTLIEDKDK
jgi:hypothetical protein